MAGSFLDTTVVVMAADPSTNVAPAESAKAAIRATLPCEVPTYAFRELLAGFVRNLCDAHNVLLASENEAEAALAILRLPAVQGRSRDARLVAIFESIRDAYRTKSAGARDELRMEAMDALAVRAHRCWNDANRLPSTTKVQPLACFIGGKLGIGTAGELRGPGGTFNCDANARCAAAAYMYEDRVTLNRLIDALAPEALPPEAAAKNENRQRRKVLREIENRGPISFSKRGCRAIGDAYFVAKCPPGAVVLTTNRSDFEPLCAAVGKTARAP